MPADIAAVLIAAVAVLVFVGAIVIGVRRRRRGKRLWPWILSGVVGGYCVFMLVVFTAVPP